MVAKEQGVGEGWVGSLGLTDADYYTERIKNKVPPCSTGNYIQYPLIHYNGKEYEKDCLYVYYIYIYI